MIKIDTSKQGYRSKYKRTTFFSEAGFKRWVKKNAKYVLKFVDSGQDCLVWTLDEHGEVLDANLQTMVWNSMVVDLSSLEVGKPMKTINLKNKESEQSDFVIETVIEYKEQDGTSN